MLAVCVIQFQLDHFYVNCNAHFQNWACINVCLGNMKCAVFFFVSGEKTERREERERSEREREREI